MCVENIIFRRRKKSKSIVRRLCVCKKKKINTIKRRVPRIIDILKMKKFFHVERSVCFFIFLYKTHYFDTTTII